MPKNKKLFESRIIKILNKDYKEKLIDETTYKMLVKSDTNKATSVLKEFLSEYWGVLTDSEIAAEIISKTLWLQQLIREQKSNKKSKKKPPKKPKKTKKPKKLSKRAKWRKKVEDKLYKQHKEARKKFGVPKCNTGEVIREGYYRKPYTKKNGNKVKGSMG